MSPIWVILFVVLLGFCFFGNGGREFEFGMGNLFGLFFFVSFFPYFLLSVCHHPLLK